MSTQFYVTLPSNTEKDGTASNFRVKLPHRLKLDGAWEVALAELIYPNAWFNLKKGENTIYLLIETPKEKHVEKIVIPAGNYESPEELFKEISRSIARKSVYIPEINEKTINFTIDYTINQTKIIIDPNIVKEVRADKKLSTILGFQHSKIYKFVSTDVTPQVVRYSLNSPNLLEYDLETMYVYCNVVENQIVGTIIAPLLRIIEVQGKYKSIVNRVYDSPHYVPVLLKDICWIEINIKNDMNKFISFEFGKVVVKLHFRRALYY